MSSHVGEGEYRKKPTDSKKDIYELKRELVPTAPGKELFEKKQPIGRELTTLEIEKLENYSGRLLLVGV